MEVLIENNPVIRKVWNDWMKKDRELSVMTKEERLDYCKEFQWVYPKETKGFVDLESIYSSVHHKSNREEFKRWFYVVCGYMLSRVHLGDNSYYHYRKIFKKLFRRDRCTSVDFPKQVILVLAMMGYITELGSWYVFNQGCNYNRGYHFIIDREKLVYWDSLDDKEWKMTHTEGITFKEDGYDPERTSWTLHPDWLSERQYETIKSLEVSRDGIEQSSRWFFNYDEYQYYYHLTKEEQEDLKDEWGSFQKLRDLSCGIVGGCKDDSKRDDGKKGYAGRFYTTVVNMKSDHRHKYLRLDGELVTEVDIANAQPTFLGIMIYKETGVMSEWLRQCLGGHFYDGWIKEITGCTEDRKTIKKLMMRYLYSCYQPHKKKDFQGEHKPGGGDWKKDGLYLGFQKKLNEYLKVNEPDIYKKIDYFKRHPEYREDKDYYSYSVDETGETQKKKEGKGKWCSKLSYYLVREEVDYIKHCIRSLPEDLKFFTIHDCICVPESKSTETQLLMEKISKQLYGVTLKLKRENTSQDYS